MARRRKPKQTSTNLPVESKTKLLSKTKTNTKKLSKTKTKTNKQKHYEFDSSRSRNTSKRQSSPMLLCRPRGTGPAVPAPGQSGNSRFPAPKQGSVPNGGIPSGSRGSKRKNQSTQTHAKLRGASPKDKKKRARLMKVLSLLGALA